MSEQIIMNLLQSLRREGKTIVIVHHDLSKVVDYFDKVVILNKKVGRLWERSYYFYS